MCNVQHFHIKTNYNLTESLLGQVNEGDELTSNMNQVLID